MTQLGCPVCRYSQAMDGGYCVNVTTTTSTNTSTTTTTSTSTTTTLRYGIIMFSTELGLKGGVKFNKIHYRNVTFTIGSQKSERV